MKKKDIQELRNKEKEELIKLAQEAKRELEQLRLDMRLRKSKNTSLIREKRKYRARLLTLLTEKGGAK